MEQKKKQHGLAGMLAIQAWLKSRAVTQHEKTGSPDGGEIHVWAIPGEPRVAVVSYTPTREIGVEFVTAPFERVVAQATQGVLS